METSGSSTESFSASASAASPSTSLAHKNPFAIQELLGLSANGDPHVGVGGAGAGANSAKDFKFSVSSALTGGGPFGNCPGKHLLGDAYGGGVTAAAAAVTSQQHRTSMYLNSGLVSAAHAAAAAGGNAFSPGAFGGIPHFFHVDANKQDPYGRKERTFCGDRIATAALARSYF